MKEQKVWDLWAVDEDSWSGLHSGHPWVKSLPNMDVSQSWCERFGEEVNFLPLSEIESLFLGLPSCSLVAMLTTLFRFEYRSCGYHFKVSYRRCVHLIFDLKRAFNTWCVGKSVFCFRVGSWNVGIHSQESGLVGAFMFCKIESYAGREKGLGVTSGSIAVFSLFAGP